MKVIIFGASGMVGQGVLRECILDPDITAVLSIGRSPLGRQHEKFREIVRQDLFDYAPIEDQLRGYDACFFCLGVSSLGMAEENYRNITYDLTMAAAQTLAKLNPNMAFIYVSGAGTDSTERGRTMWARVKGQTENALLRLPFKAAYMFRPGYIQPLRGIKSKTKLYRALYAIISPMYPLLQRIFPKYVITTEQLGCAMIQVAKQDAPKKVLEVEDIRRCCPAS
jgi:uncharacterized protein YbjT (DUF2867 family)